MVRQCMTSSRNLSLLEAFEHVICSHWHTAALLLKFFATSYRSSAFRLSDIVGGNEDGNRDKARRNDRDGTIAGAPSHNFFHHDWVSQN
jgi:hypothetical protein